MSLVSFNTSSSDQMVLSEESCSKISPINSSVNKSGFFEIAKEIDFLRSRYLTHFDDEIKRLENQKRVKKINRECNGIITLSKDAKVALYRSLELLESIQKDYFVFNHGTSMRIAVLNELTTQIQSSTSSEGKFHDLRHRKFLEDIPKHHHAQWYENQQVKRPLDHIYFNELISADCFLEHDESMESAIDFLKTGEGVCIDEEIPFIHSCAETIFFYHLFDKTQVDCLTRRLMQIIKDIPSFKGMLYSICVPKEKFHEIGYVSKPFGYPYKGFSLEDLDRLQQGTCLMQDDIPQIRLLSHKLKREEGIFAIPHYTLTQSEMEKIQRSISSIAEDVLSWHLGKSA